MLSHTVRERVAARAAAAPEAIAVVHGDEHLSHGALAARAGRLARELRRRGVGPEERVAIHLRRGLDMVAALLAVHRAGGAYVPLDPAFPAERLAYMAADARVAAAISDQPETLAVPAGTPVIDLAASFWDEPATEETRPAPPLGPESLAYVIYTSGSTGRPKGVQVTHGALAAFLAAMAERPGLAAADVLLAVTTLSFDIAGLELFLPLVVGAKVVIAPAAVTVDGERLAALLAASRATVMQATPATWKLLLAAGWEPGPGLAIFCGGEALSRDLAERLLAGGAPLWNLYGPTETTIWSAVARVASGAGPVAIGQAIAGTELAILDRGLRPVPAGETGELWIGGAGLARGYLGRPALTAERFVPDPAAAQAGARLYRTGDLARQPVGGEIEILGRADQQVKVRGFRIELGEIETVLREHPGIADAAVVAATTRGGDVRLVAYLVAGTEPPPDLRALQGRLASRLPEYMRPALLAFLPALPLTPNQKVDRKALAERPAPETARVSPAGEAAAPARSATEELVAGTFAAVLETGEVGVEEDFFGLGGHSLLAGQVTARLARALAIELPAAALFAHPTPAGLAREIDARLRAGARPSAPPLVPVPRAASLALSFAQERLWRLHQLAPTSTAYNLPSTVRFANRLEVGAFAAAVADLAARHEILRTTYTVEEGAMEEGRAVQRITSPPAVRLPVIDLGALPPVPAAAVVAALARREAARPFRLTEEPPFRVRLLRRAVEPDLALLTCHQIAADGWSQGLLIHDLAELYQARREGREAALPALALQYADFAAWQRQTLAEGGFRDEIAFWRQHLDGASPVVELPFDRPRPHRLSDRGGEVVHLAPAAVPRGVEQLARQTGTTAFMVYLAAFAGLLSRVSGQRDLTLGTSMAGRDPSELEPLIGPFVNPRPLRLDLTSEPSFRGLVGRARTAALGAFLHHRLPFARLIEELAPESGLLLSSFFQVLFVLDDRAASSGPAAPSLVSEEPATTVAELDLTLALSPLGADGMAISWLFRQDLFDVTTITRLEQQFRAFLAAGVATPERPFSALPLLSPAEAQQIAEWNDTAVSWGGEAPLPRLLAEALAQAPEAVAVVSGDEHLSAAALAAWSSRGAHGLMRAGVTRGSLVGIAAERSLELVAGLLAILAAGGAYVPLDPDLPATRLAGMVEDAGVDVVLAQPRWRSLLPASGVTVLDLVPFGFTAEAETAPDPGVGMDDLAYAIFTSGSTGRPKAALNRHRGIVNRLLWMDAAYPLGRQGRVLQKTPFSFDVSVWEFFWPLLKGATLVLAAPEGHRDPAYLAALIDAERVTTLHFVPAMLRAFLEEEASARLASVELVLASGEALTQEAVELFHRRLPQAELHNLYGPTEAAVDVTYHPARPGSARSMVPIGRPVANTAIHGVDRAGNQLPIGVVGELLLGGVQVGRGYLGRPRLTAERFVPDPFGGLPGERLYRTGDLSRFLPGGEVEFLGRIDFQVKIRGLRIELGEIEALLLAAPEVEAAVVVARKVAAGELALVAYWVPRGGLPVEASELEARRLALAEALERQLPAYMVPRLWVALPALPTTPSGKLDRKALPAPVLVEVAAGAEPADELEAHLAELFAELLGRERVGVRDNFFALGGHSLLANRLLARIERELGPRLPFRTLFEAATAAELAHLVRNGGRAPAAAVGLTAHLAERQHAPLSFAQERMWLHDQLDPGSNAFNIAHALRLCGTLSAPALAASFREVVRRHEILRTRLVARPAPVQVIDPPPATPLRWVDLSALPVAAGEAVAERLAVANESRPFDLARGPLLRVVLVRLAPGEAVLSLALHHILADGWSLGVLIDELSALYRARLDPRAPALAPLALQYADFAAWQRRWATEGALDAQLAYWTESLGAVGTAPALVPTDHPGSRAGGDLGLVRREIAPETLAALGRLSRGEDATLFMTLLAVLQTLIHRYSGGERVVIGCTSANRSPVEVEGLIGFFVNVLPIATQVPAAATFRDLLHEVRRAALGAFAHQEAPYERILERALAQPSGPHGQPRSPRNAVFQMMVLYQSMPLPELALPGLEASAFDPGNSGKRAAFDLTWTFVPEGDRLVVLLAYDRGLYEAATVERLLGHFEAVIADVLVEPLLPVAELPQVALPRAELPRAALAGATAEDGRLWLTAGPSTDGMVAGEAVAPGARVAVGEARERFEAIQGQVDARRSKLSDKQMALLRLRLRR